MVLLSFCSPTTASINEKCKPTGMSVNLLTHADQVFLNGYPVNTPLNEAVSHRENFQFTEIAQQQPFFGWVVNSDRNNTIQTAYRIIVASTPENIQNETGDFWDSGKVESSQSININYTGKPLEPGKVYFWKVKTWDNHGNESPWSSVSQFKTAAKLVDYATARYPLQKQDQFPVSIKAISNAIRFTDFEKNAFGRLRLTLFSKTGTDTIAIHFGEVKKEGTIDRKPGGSRRYYNYILALKGGWNTYIIAIRPDKRNTGPAAIPMPEYVGDVIPFRYCEIEGYNQPIEKHQIVRETVFYPFDETESYFSSSDTILNQVWDLCKYSMKATSFTGTYVDGDRERIPYEADALINQLGHYGVAREFSIARYSHEYLLHHATWPTEWILQSVLMAWNDYLHTGNSESLENFYTDLKAKTLLTLADESGFISTTTGKVTPEVYKSIHLKDKLRDIVDWPHTGILGLGKNEAGETDGFVFQDINTVVNAYHYFALNVMGTIAAQLGKEDESEFYSNQAAKLKQGFNAQLIDKKRKIYIDGIGTDHSSLHANMFPLAFGLAPEKNIATINEFIQSRGMACSVYGSQFLMEAIYDGNNAEYGLQLLSSTDERSWYNMIRAGSTISMEAWDNKYKPNQDWNHAWGAAPANIIPRKLMGIEPLEPGFGKIRIKPQPASLESAEIKCPTIRGDVLVLFKNQSQKSFVLNITIPANTSATVYLPFWNKLQKVTMNGEPVSFTREGEFAIIKDIGSGNTIFEISNR
ncbi:MAG: alpha-L-rhamnosidase [Bacteroidetes bacterium GWF2_42_66]|nr:MAG: alpha-L-rhamnosidase [Bacteroidetes bacterium GWA2_42_15]OFY01375.1 MAG: alpha-L-rhamnosidase [Bacteroidetes bacterium GWE2_42_39]OFY42219.1 MAG: alpha-L-rhamnosidase [Bacteroidetes bacterium GWF2_42_66]